MSSEVLEKIRGNEKYDQARKDHDVLTVWKIAEQVSLDKFPFST
jgi:hypothetical protein